MDILKRFKVTSELTVYIKAGFSYNVILIVPPKAGVGSTVIPVSVGED